MPGTSILHTFAMIVARSGMGVNTFSVFRMCQNEGAAQESANTKYRVRLWYQRIVGAVHLRVHLPDWVNRYAG